jgi:hypothetical protein
MIITFHEIWYFIETTYVDYDVLHLIDPNTGKKISPSDYVIETPWEKRFDMNRLRDLWEENYTFIVHGSCVTPEVKNLILQVEHDNNVYAHSHIYMGKFGSRSFSIHADNPNNLIVQCIGKSKVTIYNEYGNEPGQSNNSDLTIKEQCILEPGNSVFIPALQYHLFEPLTDRLSISIPMYKR